MCAVTAEITPSTIRKRWRREPGGKTINPVETFVVAGNDYANNEHIDQINNNRFTNTDR